MFGQHEYVLHEYDPHEYDPQEYDLYDNHDPYDPLNPFYDEGYGEHFTPPDFSKSPLLLRRRESILPDDRRLNKPARWVFVSRTVDIVIMLVLAVVGVGLGFLWFVDRTPTYIDNPSSNYSWARELFSLWGTSSMRWLFINVVVAVLVATSGLLSSFGGSSSSAGGDGRQRLGADGDKFNFDGLQGQNSIRASESMFIGPGYETPEVYNPFAENEQLRFSDRAPRDDIEEVKPVPPGPKPGHVEEVEAGRSADKGTPPVAITKKGSENGDVEPEMSAKVSEGNTKERDLKEPQGESDETIKEAGLKEDVGSKIPKEGDSEKDKASEINKPIESREPVESTKPDESAQPTEITKSGRQEESKASEAPSVKQPPASESSSQTGRDTSNASTTSREIPVSSEVPKLEGLPRDVPSFEASVGSDSPKVDADKDVPKKRPDSGMTAMVLEGRSPNESRGAAKEQPDVLKTGAIESSPPLTLALGTSEVEPVDDSKHKLSRALPIEGASGPKGIETATTELRALPPTVDHLLAVPAIASTTNTAASRASLESINFEALANKRQAPSSERGISSLPPMPQVADAQPLTIRSPQAHISSSRKLRISPPPSPPLEDDIPLPPPPPPDLDLPPTPSPSTVSRNFAEHVLLSPPVPSGKPSLGAESSQKPIRYVSLSAQQTLPDLKLARTLSESFAPAVTQTSRHSGSALSTMGQPPVKREVPWPSAHEPSVTSMREKPEHRKLLEQEGPSREEANSFRAQSVDGYQDFGQYGEDVGALDAEENSSREDPLHQKIESFLAEFHENWRLQRQESLARYKRKVDEADK